MANKEIAVKEKERYKRSAAQGGPRATSNKKKSKTTGGGRGDSSDGCGGAAAAACEWKQLKCWVRCGPDGEPLEPLQCQLQTPSEAPSSTAAPSTGASEPPRPRAAQRWKDTLPRVTIKQEYVNPLLPDISSGGGRTKPWPIKFAPLTLPGFSVYLKTVRGMKKGQMGDVERGVARLLNMLEVNGTPLDSADAASDPKILAAFYLQDAATTMFSLGILNFAYTWTRKFVEGLKAFCDYQVWWLTKREIEDEESAGWSKCKAAITQLHVYLGGGITKLINEVN